FYNCTALTAVYYCGTETEWNNIDIKTDNESLINVTRYYYSNTKPTTPGNYWHYDENGNPVVWDV
ncbi:MAG: hypothetical protein II368_01725, partial [Clostridia bacterium]|nr:hypothetical protein [Clostridia bacterium]